MLKLLLYPISAIYGFIVSIRNFLYDYKLFQSTEFEIPVISIGNITVGGTGKTPHTEYLVDLLRKQFRIATISRGYKRKTKGYLEVELNSLATTVGDEPLQIKTKFNEIQVIVDEKRVNAIENIQKQEPELLPDIILLDDAFQHRSVTAGINILLIDFNRPINKDMLLPAGRLRESKWQMRRANVIIYTKCPPEIAPITRRIIMNDVNLRPYQNLFFTTMVYQPLSPVFPEEVIDIPDLASDKVNVLLVTGIANPEHLHKYLITFAKEIIELEFPDHHNFKDSNIQQIEQTFAGIDAEKKIIITTEKDSMRLKDMDLSPSIKANLFYIPLKIKFLDSEGKNFDEKIITYVRENKSNRDLHKRKNKKAS
ncbi:MAG TPA: tetraacyldisaccharide 4'-kinase [Prolixibacteraceae bacterium]|nr:tetraacyldisaccharide 4'-kinase [Prolixibacteraceae bacterium]